MGRAGKSGAKAKGGILWLKKKKPKKLKNLKNQ